MDEKSLELPLDVTFLMSDPARFNGTHPMLILAMKANELGFKGCTVTRITMSTDHINTFRRIFTIYYTEGKDDKQDTQPTGNVGSGEELSTSQTDSSG